MSIHRPLLPDETADLTDRQGAILAKLRALPPACWLEALTERGEPERKRDFAGRTFIRLDSPSVLGTRQENGDDN